MYQVMNLPNAYGVANPQQWIIEKRPDHMLAPPFTLPGWPRMGASLPNAWGIYNPTQYIVEERPEVTWMPWFAPGGSAGGPNMGRAFLPQVRLRA